MSTASSRELLLNVPSERFRELLETMHESRMKRLEHAGFTPEQAERISRLHTPNFM